MDYGHTKPSTDPSELGSSVNSEVNNNLDLTNPETNWDQPAPIEHDKKALGSEALANSLEMPPLPEQELGQPIPYTTNLEPFSKPPEDVNSDASIIEDSLTPDIAKFVNPKAVKEEGGKAPAHVIKAMDQIQEEFNRGEISPDHLTELRNDLIGEYLQGSFNRKTALKKDNHEEAA